MFTDDMIDELKEDLSEKVADDDENKSIEGEKNEAVQLLQQGKRNLLVKDYESAVETLGKACQKFCSIYGDFSAECTEPQMNYGNALLELWRYEEANKKEDEVEETDKSIKCDIIDEDETVEADEPDDNECPDEGKNETKDAEVVANCDIVGEAAENDESKNGNDENAVDETIDENGDENEEDIESEDDADNLQLAWEIFETVKNICVKYEDKSNLARVYMKLGEVSIASGNYDLAIEDLKRGLEILDKQTIVDSRQIANNHFLLYSAYWANGNISQAGIEIRTAKSILEDQLAILERKLEKLDTETNSSEISKINTEVKELKELINDMNVKIAELDIDKRKMLDVIKNRIETEKPATVLPDTTAAASSSFKAPADSSSNEMAASSSSSSTGFSPVKPNVPVSNISHLIRKKPKMSTNEEKKIEDKTNNEVTSEAKSKPIESASETANKSNVSSSEGVNETSPNDDTLNGKRKADDEASSESCAKKVCIGQD